MSLFTQINEDMKAALKAGDKEKRSTLQMLIAKAKNQAIDLKVAELDDAATKDVILSFSKTLKDEIADLEKYGRDFAKQQNQLTTIQSYLPKQLTQEQMVQAVEAAIASTGASSKKEIGKVMAALKDLREQADMKVINTLVNERLA